MKKCIKYCLLLVWNIALANDLCAQTKLETDIIEKTFLHPPASAKPWVFWYWMHGAVSKQGITADLEAMKEVGIGGAYLMPLRDTSSAIPFQPTVRQLTPEWWEMVSFAMKEAKRLGLQLGMHVSDGFALAGGPWITPALSMQKLVWTKTYYKNGTGKIKLAQPKANENYYKDIAVFAYPANETEAFREEVNVPRVATSSGTQANFLALRSNGKDSFKSDTACWIRYNYSQPFTCRSIQIHVDGNNYQAQRLIVQAGDDSIHFKTVTRLEPPRHGWQDSDEDYTYSIPTTTARYFRFVYDKEGSEPGAEDLDAAKWKPSLKVAGIYLSDGPVIDQYEAKNGSVWRVAVNTSPQMVNDKEAIPLKSIVNLSGKLTTEGELDWIPPKGNWIIVRIGHTSTGHTNYTGGAGLGLECDKFNRSAIQLQFDNWFGKAFEKAGPRLAGEVLKIFHVDSWECGSQNWSETFPTEFKKRRGYDLMPYLLAMTGVPVSDAGTSEKVLHDVRQTIAELVNDVFYSTLRQLAHKKGCRFSAEAIAPTMVSDGMLHYKNIDLPMGEFWLNSPTHDKPNDMLDAISGGHIYGRKIIQAESFTTLRMDWSEHPGSLKTLGDRNFALGINKMVVHVFTHNPWMDRKPGMTLGPIGLYFQRDQTWFKQGKAWIEYLTRCSALLQVGKPVADIAVFTGEEVPRRAVLPDRLVNTLPGIFGKQKVEAEKKRLTNIGQPLRTIPDGVTHSANMADPEDWIDPLNGYAYDSFNPDALMQMKVVNGKVVLPGGATYSLLVLPGKHPLQPNNNFISLPAAKKILQLSKDGATIIMNKEYTEGIGLHDGNDSVKDIMKKLLLKENKKGKVIPAPYAATSFIEMGLQKDVDVIGEDHSVTWTHRSTATGDIYFISNPADTTQNVSLSFRITGKMAEVWDPVTKEKHESAGWFIMDGRTYVSEKFAPGQSLFIIFRKAAASYRYGTRTTAGGSYITFNEPWKIQFDKNYGGPGEIVNEPKLESWTRSTDPRIRYYSGTALYTNTFEWNEKGRASVWLELDSICDIAAIRLNGIDCGTLWTRPYILPVTNFLKQGLNKIEIEVSNTWHNRLIGDQELPVEERVTWTTAPFRLKDKPLLPAGLMGKIQLRCSIFH